MELAAVSMPPVVAVVMTRNPGPGLDDTLASLDDQDYAELEVLVIDDASEHDPTARIAQVLPRAFVHRLDEPLGFAAAANHAASLVEGAAFFALCHDDVALAPDALLLMVDEAVRSNAGIVAPKLVSWDDHGRISSLGFEIDRTGITTPIVARNELDQEQHDSVGDVLVADSAVLLVRSDLFRSLGGFAPWCSDEMAARKVGDSAPSGPGVGEALDLCWRACLAGARVRMVPTARVAHEEHDDWISRTAADGALTPMRLPRRMLSERNRIRTALAASSLAGLPIVILLLLAQGIGAFFGALVRGPRSRVRLVTSIWRAVFGDVRAVVADRHKVGQNRVGGAQARRLLVPVGLRLRSELREDVAEDSARAWVTFVRALRVAGRPGGLRRCLLTLTAVIVLLLVGSRHLLLGRLPVVGELLPLPGARDLWREYWTGWRRPGFGSATPATPAFAVLSALGTVTFGSTSALRKVLMLGCVPLGLFGVWRLTGRLLPIERSAARAHDSRAGEGRVELLMARVAGVTVYALVPLGYNNLARGRWQALVALGALPWLTARLLASIEPPPGGVEVPRWARMVKTALPLALVTAFAPAGAVALGTVIVGLAFGSLLAGRTFPYRETLLVTLGSFASAAVLLFPWSTSLATHPVATRLVGGARSGDATALSVIDVIGFHLGPVGSWASAGLAVAAISAVILTSGERLALVLRWFGVLLLSVVVTWLGARGWLGGGLSSPEITLAPAALALAVMAAIGAAGLGLDMRSARFGWRQLAAVAGLGAIALGAAPIVAAARSGRWGIPTHDLPSSMSWLADERGAGPFRVLWIAHHGAMPVDGWELDGSYDDGDPTEFATTRDGLADLRDLWAGSPSDAVDTVRDSLLLTADRGTTRLGHLLAPGAVKFIVVVEGPLGRSGRRREVPRDLTDGLARQLDLRQIDAPVGLSVYENDAWVPGRTVVPDAAATLGRSPDYLAATDANLAVAPFALPERGGPTTFAGDVRPGATVALAEAFSDRWKLAVRGARYVTRPHFGWTTSFEPAASPVGSAPASANVRATLRYDASSLARLALLVQLALWSVALAVVLRHRSRRPADAKLAELLDVASTDEERNEAEEIEAAFGDAEPAEGRLADELYAVFSARRAREHRLVERRGGERRGSAHRKRDGE